jgi:Cytochrome P450
MWILHRTLIFAGREWLLWLEAPRLRISTCCSKPDDSTAHTIGYALYLLARHQTVQEQLRTEILELPSTEDRQAEDYEKAPYLNAVIKVRLSRTSLCNYNNLS